MRDYTLNNYCDFLWINSLLKLKRDGRYKYNFRTIKNKKPTDIPILNVVVFGTIIEVKPIGANEFLYYVDDGTGVIACKHSPQQFEEMISLIENEQFDMTNMSVNTEQEGSYVRDTSADDSVFNDRSVQMDESNFNNQSTLRCLQSIWNDIYERFSCLIATYNVGETVLVHGKLYTYFNINQIYINSIRAIDFSEEIMLLTIKLGTQTDNLECGAGNKKRFSGLITFDNMEYANKKVILPGNVKTPEVRSEVFNPVSKVVTPNLEGAMTFDTYCNDV